MQLFISIFAACVVVFPIYLISSAITGSKKRMAAAKEKAIKRGHVVTAVLKKSSSLKRNVPGIYSGPARRGIYEYQYRGKKYKYRFWADNPPKTLTLYFLRNPRKATTEADLKDSNINWPLVYLVVTCLAYMIIKS